MPTESKAMEESQLGHRSSQLVTYFVPAITVCWTAKFHDHQSLMPVGSR